MTAACATASLRPLKPKDRNRCRADVRTTVKHQGEADGTDTEVALRLESARQITSRSRPLRYSKVLS